MMSIAELHKTVPVWLRTPEWFAARYTELYRGSDASRWGRILGLPDQGRRHPEAPGPSQFALGTPTNTPRQLRTLSGQDVASIFGSHVEWLILQFHCHHTHIIDIPSWLDFADITLRARDINPTVGRRDEYVGHISTTQRYEVDLRRLVRSRNRTYPSPENPVEDNLMVMSCYRLAAKSDLFRRI